MKNSSLSIPRNMALFLVAFADRESGNALGGNSIDLQSESYVC